MGILSYPERVCNFLSDNTWKLIVNLRPYVEVILAIILGIISIVYFKNVESGWIITCVGIIVGASRAMIFEWCKREMGIFSEMYELNKKINENEDVDFAKEAKYGERDLINKLKELSNGTLKYKNLNDYLEASKREIKNTSIMRATALISPTQWEAEGELGSYLETQIDAIKAGKLKVTRIFFLTKDEEKKAEKILRQQADNDIDVRIIDRKIYGNSISPFVVYDERLALIGTLDGNNLIVSGTKTRNDTTIKDLIGTFTDIQVKAKVFK